MSVSSAQGKVASIQRDVESLNRKLADLARDEASKSGKIASITGSINRHTTPSSLESKQRDILSLQNDIARIQEKKADVAKDIARETEKLHRAQQAVYSEQNREQRRSLEALERQAEDRERDALYRLQMDASRAPMPTGFDGTAHYDAFISHATEDKDDLVRPLAEVLRSLGHSIWYDEFQLRVGDSLRRSIDRGLATSRFGIVVLSPSFFAKNWTQYELDGLVAREMAGGKVVLPIWHKVSKNEVIGRSPTLADKVALNTASYTVQELAKALSDVMRPEGHS